MIDRREIESQTEKKERAEIYYGEKDTPQKKDRQTSGKRVCNISPYLIQILQTVSSLFVQRNPLYLLEPEGGARDTRFHKCI